MSNICQHCKQHRATVHLTEIDPDSNEPHEMHLCEGCARETGAIVPLQGPLLSTAATVATLASSLLSGAAEKVEGKRGGARRVTCAQCGMSYQEFRVKGRFGCAKCYDAFEDGLVTLLEKVHGSSQYVGEYPQGVLKTERTNAAIEQELMDLRRRLTLVIKNEEYEEAARVRDRIQELEKLQTGRASDA